MFVDTGVKTAQNIDATVVSKKRFETNEKVVRAHIKYVSKYD